MNILTAFFESLYSIEFYKHMNRSSISRGLLYLVMWSFVAAILMMIFFVAVLSPQITEFTQWFKSEMPIIEVRPEGLKIDRQSPYVMSHPKYGHVITFDTTKKDVTREEMGNVLLYVTSTRLYTQQSGGEIRMYDLTRRTQETAAQTLKVDADFVTGLEKRLKPILGSILAFGTLFLFFIWKMTAALFYSLLGLIINLFRRSKLSYEAVLNTTIFAMTAAMILQFLTLFLAAWVKVPFGFFGAFMITAFYLILGIKVTEDPFTPSVE